MNENPKQKINALEKRVQDIVNDDNVSLLASEEEVKAVQVELQAIIKEANSLKSRRIMLLSKTKLTSEESEEFKLLDEIVEDVEDLKALVLDFMNDFNVSKETTLERGTPELIINLKDTHGISNLELFHNINTNLTDLENSNQLFLQLGKLQISDADLASLEDEYEYENIFLLLKYCKLTNGQKEKLLSKVANCSPFDHPEAFSLLITHLSINKQQQESMILALEKSTANAHGKKTDESFSGFSMGIIDTDMLASKLLSVAQKQRIAACLVRLGNGLDCQYLLRTYPQFIDQKTRQEALQQIQSGTEAKNFSIPDFYQATPEMLKGKTIHFIVHPLYQSFFYNHADLELWRECEGDGEKYMEAVAVKEMQDFITLKNKGEVYPGKFMAIYKTLDEWTKYKNLISNKNNAVVFALPRFYNEDDDKEEYEPFHRILNNLNYGHENVFYINTERRDNGYMLERDRKFIEKVVPKNADIKLSGGFINQCLENFTEGLIKLQTKRRIVLDYSDSVASNFSRLNKFADELKSLGIPPLAISATIEVKTLEDVQAIFNQNRGFIEAYEKWTYTSSSKTSQEHVKEHIRHDR